MSIIQSDLLLGQEGSSKYQVSRSLRFNSADSAYLSRTFSSSASSSNKLTYSTWVKRTKVGSSSAIESFGLSAAVSGSSRDAIWFSGDSIEVYFNEGVSGIAATSAVFRDASAWYHIVVSIDTTKATAADRIIIYVNGVRQTVTGTQPSQNYNFTGFLVSGKEQNIGRSPQPAYYADSYLAEIHCIDGLALDPTSFAEADATTAQWIPKLYSGSYGTNGFKLNFSDNSAATAAALGKDTANSNNWTPNNFSVTAGAGNDSLVDTPTSYGTDTGAGGEVRGNYCTFNPLASTSALSNGNLDTTMSAYPTDYGRGTIGIASGKYYFEATVISGGQPLIGISPYGSGSTVGNYYGYHGAGYIYGLGGYVGPPDTPYTVGDIIGIAIDITAGSIKFYKNNSLVYTFTGIASSTYFPFYAGTNGGSTVVSWNFGQRAFAYPVSGFKALVDTNLTAPVIAKPSTVMDVKLYTGNGGTQNITGLGFSPDLVWIKHRGAGNDNHALFDVVRGTSKRLSSNVTDAEQNPGPWGNVTAFNSDGFTVGGTNAYEVNFNNLAYVSWTWDAGTSTVTNTQGSITSSVRANASAGFSIVTWTGNNSGGATLGHGLNATPGLIIVKARSITENWPVYHRSLGGTKALYLDLTLGEQTSSQFWNNTNPTSSVFSVGNNTLTNSSTSSYVAYCFAPVAGYSSFGSYVGNGSATDGPFVYTGFRPRWLMIKPLYQYDGGGSTVASTAWYIYDSARGAYNANGAILGANNSYAEENNATDIDFLSNGFKLRNNRAVNTSNGAIYCAFAESPFQYARAR